MNEFGGLPPRAWRAVISVGVVFVIVVLVGKALARGDMVMLSLPVVLGLGLFFLNRITAWFMAAIGLYFSWLYIPGLPRSLSIHHIVAGALVPVLVVRHMLRPSIPVSLRGGHVLRLGVWSYLVAMLIPMLVRGFGLRVLGSSMWGGATYVHMGIMIGLFLFSDAITLNEANWRRTLILFLCAGLIPSVAEFVYILSGGAISQQYFFIRPDGVSAQVNLQAFQQGSGVVRFQVSKYVTLLLVLMCALQTRHARGHFGLLAIGALSFVFAGLSGHRITIFFLLAYIPVYAYLKHQRIPWAMLFVYAAILLLAMVGLHLGGRLLPLSVQRAVSWIPFADISEKARYSALGTTMWRFEVWRRVLTMLPDYLLVGRGFTFQGGELYAALRSHDAGIAWAVVSHNYHSGPLSMLVDLGILGFLSGSLILIGGCVRHIRLRCAGWHSEQLDSFHRALLAMVVVHAIIFFFLHGDAAYTVIDVLMLFMILEGLHRTDHYLKAQAEEETGADDTGRAEATVMGPFSGQPVR